MYPPYTVDTKKPVDPALIAQLDQLRSAAIEFAETVVMYHTQLSKGKLPAALVNGLTEHLHNTFWEVTWDVNTDADQGER